MVDFLMPSLGADMEAGTLVEWLVKPGDRVKRGDVVAVVETQKGAIEIETFQAGQIEQILVELKSKVRWDAAGRIRTDGEAKPAVVAAAPPPVAPAPAAPPPVSAVERPPVTPAPPPRLAPAARGGCAGVAAARRLAEERGIDLSTVNGSGGASLLRCRPPQRSLRRNTARRA